MFSKRIRHCPQCGYRIHDQFSDGSEFLCPVCRSRFRVILDDTTGKAAFYEESSGQLPEPLGLPRGSIRALTAIAASLSCWAVMIAGGPVPGALLGLTLTVLGYYFGFRARIKARGSRMYDPEAVRTQPLNLPGGAVRSILIVGFVVAGGALIVSDDAVDPKYQEFFMVLAGMVAGYIFGKVFTVARIGRVMVAVSHLKGVIVLAAAGVLAYLFVTGRYTDLPPLMVSGVCAVVSFYYGSRT